jgi:DNA invertase Pin-like site-specific DNA recombinase
MSKRVKLGSSSVAVACIRVSKEEQKLGPEAQRASIEAWARSERIHVAAWHVDQGVCSVTPIDERPALVAALASLREHAAGVLVVAKRDRIARDVVLAAMVERATASAGATIVSAAGEGNGDAPADAFMRTVIDGAAQYERALIRARTKAALGAKRAKGEKTGGDAPYGFALAVDGLRLAPVESEQKTLARARALSAEGRSLRNVAAALTSEGRFSRTGRAFAAQQIARMLATVEAQSVAA